MIMCDYMRKRQDRQEREKERKESEIRKKGGKKR